jgi:uncharacterized membrane protein YvlD (DUF360 family)
MNLKNNLFSVMGMNACLFLFLSLIAPNKITVEHFHMMVCVSIPYAIFSFLTFEYRLFSKNIWIRRVIVIAFSAINILVVSNLFHAFQLTKKHLTVYGIAIIAIALFSAFAYYINDRIEKKNLEAINKKLQENRNE